MRFDTHSESVDKLLKMLNLWSLPALSKIKQNIQGDSFPLSSTCKMLYFKIVDIMFYITRFKNNGHMNVLSIVVFELNTWFCTVSTGCVTHTPSCRLTIHVRGTLTMFSTLTSKVPRGTYTGTVGTKIPWFTFYKEQFIPNIA